MIINEKLFFVEEILIFTKELKQRQLHLVNNGNSPEFFRDVKMPEGITLFYSDKKLPVDRNNIRDFTINSKQNDYFTVEINDNYNLQESELSIIFIGKDNRRHKVLIHIFQKPEIFSNEFVFGIVLDQKGLSLYCRDLNKGTFEEVLYRKEPIDITNRDILIQISNLIISKIQDFSKNKSGDAKFHYIFALPVFDGRELYFVESAKIKRIFLNSLSQLNINENIHFISGAQAIGFYFLEKDVQSYESSGDMLCLCDSDDNNTDLILMKLRDKTRKIEDRFELLSIIGLYQQDIKSHSITLTSEFFYQFFKWFQIKRNLKEDFLKYVFIVGNNTEAIKSNLNSYIGDKLKTGFSDERLQIMSKGAALAFKISFPFNYAISWNLFNNSKSVGNREIIFSTDSSWKGKEAERILNNISSKYYIQFYLNINDISYRIGYNTVNGVSKNSNKYILKFNLTDNNQISVYSTEHISNVRKCLFKYDLETILQEE